MADPHSLEERKELLLARSTLYRLQMQHETITLRRSLSSPRTIISLARSSPMRLLLLGAIVAVAGRDRTRRLVSGALTAIAIARAIRATLGMLGDRPKR